MVTRGPGASLVFATCELLVLHRLQALQCSNDLLDNLLARERTIALKRRHEYGAAADQS